MDYFDAYADVSVHELMLKDTVRNEAYRRAIEEVFADSIKGRVVLDVGSGTGVLSMMAARAGARRVFAVEASPMADLSRHIISHNGFEEIIEVINERMEDVELPEKVDVIISEWMGFYLFHENMLPSVLYARDRWLKPNGAMFPSSATLYATAVDMDSFMAEKVGWCEEPISGFDMSALFLATQVSIKSAPHLHGISASQIASEVLTVATYDLLRVTLADLERVSSALRFTALRSTVVHGLCLFFDCAFDVPHPSSNESSATAVEPVLLQTGPDKPQTHWKQSVFYLPTELTVTSGDPINVNLDMRVSSEHARRYNVTLEIDASQPTHVGLEYDEDCPCPKCRLLAACFVPEEAQEAEGEGEGAGGSSAMSE